MVPTYRAPLLGSQGMMAKAKPGLGTLESALDRLDGRHSGGQTPGL
jgi:hypothetical protein